MVYVTGADNEALFQEASMDTSDPNWQGNLPAEIIEKHNSMKVVESDKEVLREDLDPPLSGE